MGNSFQYASDLPERGPPDLLLVGALNPVEHQPPLSAPRWMPKVNQAHNSPV